MKNARRFSVGKQIEDITNKTVVSMCVHHVDQSLVMASNYDHMRISIKKNINVRVARNALVQSRL